MGKAETGKHLNKNYYVLNHDCFLQAKLDQHMLGLHSSTTAIL